MSRSKGAARVLGTSVCLGSLLALSAPAASASTTNVSCTEIESGVVSCLLPDGLSEFSTTSLLSAAQDATEAQLTTATPMVITAFGGAGRYGDNGGGLYQGGSGGAGGMAQTVTTVSEYQESYGSPVLYYYVGELGGTSPGGRGGASTLVSSVDLTEQAPCIDDFGDCTDTTLLADAAGGGGGGQGNANGDGGAGGDGGVAVSGRTVHAGADGQDGLAIRGTLTRTGRGGEGASDGDGGDGGRGGGGTRSKDGTDGQDGIGGLGGPVHTSNGPNAGASWITASQLFFGPAGQGGEGQWRVNSVNYGSGGGGGGGWGGGGGGGGGGEAVSGGGGGGGGSWAAPNTASISDVPVISNPNIAGDGSVHVTFVGGPAAADAPGDDADDDSDDNGGNTDEGRDKDEARDDEARDDDQGREHHGAREPRESSGHDESGSENGRKS
ncbi:hypothetical protein [Streptomyces sp. NPDC059828]|uniref:hypothetical protein n=1 Tax=Streptomyces sp. NPDC059828 TaxID=3346965 RepID=UPI00365B2741